MNVRAVSLDQLQAIAYRHRALVTVDATGRKAYVRIAQTRYVAALEDES